MEFSSGKSRQIRSIFTTISTDNRQLKLMDSDSPIEETNMEQQSQHKDIYDETQPADYDSQAFSPVYEPPRPVV